MARKVNQFFNVFMERTSLKLASPEMHDGEQIGTVQFMQRMLSCFNHINGSEKEMETFMLSILDAPYSLSEYVIQRQLQK
jgi:hypothetical protein